MTDPGGREAFGGDQKEPRGSRPLAGEQNMKRQKMILVTLLWSVVLLTILSANVAAQQGRRVFGCDSGVYKLKDPDQVLRVTIDWGDGAESPATVRFRQLGYLEQGNIYKVAAETTTDPITLAAGEAAHIDISQGEFGAVRGVVYVGGSTRDAIRARVTFQIISKLTGRVESVLVALLLPE
jgi:hypothetical protein